MKDTPLEYTAWSLATFLKELKADNANEGKVNAGMGTIGELYSRFIEAGLASRNDVSIYTNV